MNLKQAILKTLSYHDIFNYPLTKEEIHTYLIGKSATEQEIEQALNILIKEQKIGERRTFYYLRGRAALVTLRLKRRAHSKPKLKKAHFFANILKAIPSVKMVAISGALAMENSHRWDDIDLVIVTAKNTLYTSRFFANILLFFHKRSPDGAHVANRACLNLFIDEKHLTIKPQNLYIAHEICQMKLLWDRDQTYSKLIKENLWIGRYIPNWEANVNVHLRGERSSLLVHLGGGKRIVREETRNKGVVNILSRIASHLFPLETLLKKFQLFYMHSKVSTERIGEKQLFFHPQDTHKHILAEYKSRLQKHHIST